MKQGVESLCSLCPQLKSVAWRRSRGCFPLEDWLFNLSHKAVAMHFGLDGAEQLHEPLRVDGS